MRAPNRTSVRIRRGWFESATDTRKRGRSGAMDLASWQGRRLCRPVSVRDNRPQQAVPPAEQRVCRGGAVDALESLQRGQQGPTGGSR